MVVWIVATSTTLALLGAALLYYNTSKPSGIGHLQNDGLSSSDPGGQPNQTSTLTNHTSNTLESNYADLRHDLRLLEYDVDFVKYAQIITTIAGLGLSFVGLSLGASAIGIAKPLAPILLICLAFGLAGFYFPIYVAKRSAATKRNEFGVCLGQYVEFVLAMTNGGYPTTASLIAASRLGEGWAWTELQQTVVTAAKERTNVFAALAELGNKLSIVELSNLAQRLNAGTIEEIQTQTDAAPTSADTNLNVSDLQVS